MNHDTATLARSITWTGSKQAYYTARLVVDKDLADDFCRAYAYFRWIDDAIDAMGVPNEKKISFIRRQRDLIDCLYKSEQLSDLLPEEQMLAELINHDKMPNSGLRSLIYNMFAIIEFDAYRKERHQAISAKELKWYTDSLGKAVTDGLQYFIGNGFPYPKTDNRYKAAIAAHITHLLRDMVGDTADGFINIPLEYLQNHNISPNDLSNPAFRVWVRERAKEARQYFSEGCDYLDRLDVLRCKIAGYWYCARFKGTLEEIESDDYILRASYKSATILTCFKMAWLTFVISLRHIAHQKGKH